MSKTPLVSSLNMNLKDVASTSESTVTDASSEELTEYPPTKMIRLESSLLQNKDESVSLDQLDKLNTKVDALSSEVSKLVNLCTQRIPSSSLASSTVKSHNLSSSEGEENTHERISHSRGVEDIVNLLGINWTLQNEGFKCIACSQIILYNHREEGIEFDKNDNLPRSFRNVKTTILRHLNSESHKTKTIELENSQFEYTKQLKKGKECGLNCASIAYTSLYFSESRNSYEHHVADVYNCGGLVGSKNHSGKFPYSFLPHVYDVIRSEIKDYITLNFLPFGIMADKMTTRHLTRHMVGVRIPIWDVRSSYFSKDIYVQCSPIKDVTGLGVTRHFLETIEAFGIDQLYQREYISGCAMDGQYIHLNVPDHLKDIFLKDIPVTWDPAHRIELSIKDTTSTNEETSTFIEKVSDTIQSIMKLISYGKPYLDLLTSENISDHFFTPKIFKSMKFVGHCSAVLKSFSTNYASIVTVLKEMNTHETEGLLKIILDLGFVLDYLFMKDVLYYLTICSKTVQKSTALPWVYPDVITSTLSTLSCMIDSLKFQDLSNVNLSKLLFPEFNRVSNIIKSREFNGCQLTISRGNQRAVKHSVGSDDHELRKVKYTEYLNKLKEHIETRFNRGTYRSCKMMGNMLNFNWLLFPSNSTNHITDIDALKVEDFKAMVETISFSYRPENNSAELLFEYKQIFKFACALPSKFLNDQSITKDFNESVYKQFVLKNKDTSKYLYKFLSFVASFPTSEAIVESWGSSIEHIYKKKTHTREGLDLSDTGTVDKLVFLRLNGPPPGLLQNKKLFKSALCLMFKGDFSSHFLHIGRNLNATSLVIDRIHNADDALPCFL